MLALASVHCNTICHTCKSYRCFYICCCVFYVGISFQRDNEAVMGGRRGGEAARTVLCAPPSPPLAMWRRKVWGEKCCGLSWEKTRLPPPTPAGASPGTPRSSLLVWQMIWEKDRGVLIETKDSVCYMFSIYRLGQYVHLFIWCLWKAVGIITINIRISAWLSCSGEEPVLCVFNDVAKFTRFSHVTEVIEPRPAIFTDI